MFKQQMLHARQLVDNCLSTIASADDCSWPIRVEPDAAACEAQGCREVDALVTQHCYKSRAIAKGMLHIGFTMDKASIRGMELSNGFAVLPIGTAFAFMPQAFVFV